MECAPGDLFYSDFPSADACASKDLPVLAEAEHFADDVIVCLVPHKKSHLDVCLEV